MLLSRTLPHLLYMKFRSYAESAKAAYDVSESMGHINKIRGISEDLRQSKRNTITRRRKEVAKYWGPNAKVDWTDPKVQKRAERAIKDLADAKKAYRKKSERSRRGKK